MVSLELLQWGRSIHFEIWYYGVNVESKCSPNTRWNSYNHYACIPNETIILSNAQAIVDFGLKDAGYFYVTTDCGWTLDHRLDDGTLGWNKTLFPSGFPNMGKKIHQLGLGFGIYSDAGILMCMNGAPNQTGSLGMPNVEMSMK
jgi:alpha-galactosidase